MIANPIYAGIQTSLAIQCAFNKIYCPVPFAQWIAIFAMFLLFGIIIYIIRDIAYE